MFKSKPDIHRAIQFSCITLVGGVCNPDSCGKPRAFIPDNAQKTEWLYYSSKKSLTRAQKQRIIILY